MLYTKGEIEKLKNWKIEKLKNQSWNLKIEKK